MTSTDDVFRGLQRLRYKDYKLIHSGVVEDGKLQVEPGSVKEFESMKVLVPELTECGTLDWWNLNVGFTKGDG